MPKVAILLSVVFFCATLTGSHALLPEDMIPENVTRQAEFGSGIVGVDPGFFSEGGFKRYLIFGTGQSPGLPDAPLYGTSYNHGFFHVAVLPENLASTLASGGYGIIEDFELDFHSEEPIDASRIAQISRSDLAQKDYNATGKGTTIAIVDTGVDFSNPDIQHSLARDENNHPIMLDPDGQGIVLTNATFFAFIDKDEIIRNYTRPIPPNMTSSVYVSDQGVFLDISRGGEGTEIPIYNSFFPNIGNSTVFNGTLVSDIKIGSDNRDYIKSKSGVYHLGIIYQGATTGPLARVQVVPVLVVDSFVSGVYDTIIPDMSTSWKDYTRFDLEPGEDPGYDFDFTDEKPIVLGSGKEFLVFDSNNDGKNDYSAGTAGAQVLDLYAVIQNKTVAIDHKIQAVNGTLLPALDPDGNFFGIMTDFVGHGTSSTASIVSRGVQTYDIYGDSQRYSITGVAPDASIIPIKTLWFGDIVYGWLWSAGFDSKGHDWKFTGHPRADIISNSWGVSTFPSFETSPGMDILSLILGALATPGSINNDYPGVLMISSAGNSGHGYGTIGLPSASPFGISVGATTNNVFVGHGQFKDQPRFGNTTSHYNHVADFSSRGPSSIGDPKPDLMSIGAYGFVPSNVIKTEKNSTAESFSLFGGTSMAAPVVSGGAAVLIEAMKRNHYDADPFTVKNILMSTADDLKNDPFTQGSGLADILSALDYISGKNGSFIIHNDASYHNIRNILSPAAESINSTAIGLERFGLPSSTIPMTGWFAGQLVPGERSHATFTISNPSETELIVDIVPKELSLVAKKEFDGRTDVRRLDTTSNKSDAYIPSYVWLSDVQRPVVLSEFFDEDDPIPDESSLMVLNVNFEFDEFMNKTSELYASDIGISSLYMYDWLDGNNDTKITSDELSLVNRAGSWGTVQELRITDPNEKFEGVPLVGVYPVPVRYSYWTGPTEINSTSMDYTLSVSHYKKERWSAVWVESKQVTIPSGGSVKVDVTLVVPTDMQTGAYQGFLTFEGKNHTANAPVSFVVKQPIEEDNSVIVISGKQSGDVMYGNGYTKGAFDMSNRYMAGDWRQYYFDIINESINSAAVELSWEDEDTNLSVFVTDPSGRIVQTNVASGVFGHFQNWPSIDWLGSSSFGQGGGFFPVKNKNDTSTVLFVPINRTGTYTILVHSTLFGGNSTTEPITVAAKFTDISLEMIEPPVIQENYTEPVPDTPFIRAPIKAPDTPDSFGFGILLGVITGSAIGIICMLILRQKP